MSKQDMSIGHRLRLARKARGLTQEQLGRLVNLGRSAVSHHELGLNDIDIDTLRRYARALGRPLSYFLGEE